MLRLTRTQRTMLVDKLPDLANLAAAGLVFGQFLGSDPFSFPTAVSGFLLWVVGMSFAAVFARRDV